LGPKRYFNLKIIISDNGNEFKMRDLFNSKGSIHQTTYVETPEQNGIAEKKTPTFVECY